MLHPILTKLELDVMQASELADAVELAVQHQMPAIVIHQMLATDAIFAKGRRQGRFKIITAVDWPKGDIYGSIKLRGLTSEALDTDGFEIMLTPDRSDGDTTQEIATITGFIKQHVASTAEIRYVLGSQTISDANLKTMCKGLATALRTTPMPNLVRTDPHLKLQVGRANPDVHNATISLIKDAVDVPVKVSGNIGGIRALTSSPTATRFAVSVLQARQIIQELEQQPDELRQLLS